MWMLASMKGCCLGGLYGAGPMKIELKRCWSAMCLIFVGAHPVGDGLQGEAEGVCHTHRPQGWAPTRVFACW